ncbi:MAG: hypothetical protein WCD70_00545, partial [Alphaproteobacteria bacterium]
MNRGLQIIFVLLVLIGTSSDAILRQFFPQYEIGLDIFYVVTLIGAAWMFHKLAPEQRLLMPRLNAGGIRRENPFKALWNTNDPLLLIRFFAAFLVFSQHINILLRPSKDVFSGYWVLLQGNAHAGMAVFFTL